MGTEICPPDHLSPSTLRGKMWCKDISSLHTQPRPHGQCFPTSRHVPCHRASRLLASALLSVPFHFHVKSTYSTYLENWWMWNVVSLFSLYIGESPDPPLLLCSEGVFLSQGTKNSKITNDFHHIDMFNITSASIRPLLPTFVRTEGYIRIRGGTWADFSMTWFGYSPTRSGGGPIGYGYCWQCSDIGQPGLGSGHWVPTSGCSQPPYAALQSQDWLCNLKIGTQFLNSENVQCNLKIARIPRLSGTLYECRWQVCNCWYIDLQSSGLCQGYIPTINSQSKL